MNRLSNEDIQLWKEEPEFLIKCVRNIEGPAIFVEIGTGDGGTSRLIYDKLKGRRIKQYTIDVCPTKMALELLGNTEINIVKKRSEVFAGEWSGDKIDFIFIDGDHSFSGIYHDFFAWLPHLKKSAGILFHDFDPPERGGVAHLGVEVFLRTLLRLNIIKDTQHKYRFLSGHYDLTKLNIPLEEYWQTFVNIADKTSLKLKKLNASPNETFYKIVQNRHSLTSFEACYFIDYILQNHFELARNNTQDKSGFIVMTENLHMLRRGYGNSGFPYVISAQPNNIDDISNVISREQVVLFFLKNILNSIVNWNV